MSSQLNAQLSARVNAARDLDDIVLGLPDPIRASFGADRATIYVLGDDRASLVSKIRTGAHSFTQLKLPISARSIAGYVALSRRLLNLPDVYDEAALRSHAHDLRFQQGVDQRTGYRTREMLALPIIHGDEVLGVLQLINNLEGGPFGRAAIEGARSLCALLAGTIAQHRSLAQSNGRDIEGELAGEAGAKPAAIGRALSKHFAAPYLAFHAQRKRPDLLLAGIDRASAAQAQWLPLGASRQSVFVVCIDPEQVKAGGAVRAAFPHLKAVYCVTSRREFDAMLDQFFGDGPRHVALSDKRRDELVSVVAGLVAGTAQHGLSNLRIDTEPGEREGEIRFTVSGTLRVN